MFANSMYPATKEFHENVSAEIEDNVKRLRNHPCIALWCGNNEIEVAWHNWGWQKQYGYSTKDSTEIWENYKSIFHKLIPDKLKQLDPSRPIFHQVHKAIGENLKTLITVPCIIGAFGMVKNPLKVLKIMWADLWLNMDFNLTLHLMV
ncbi:MAG: hypothetical protein IPO32_11755 [Crocinitomicaceae bacterium]|nr:hypothetical protein [Crocinitomicaceae bacterium]